VAKTRALVVDDDAGILRLFARLMPALGWEADTFAAPEAALSAFTADRYGAAFLDCDLQAAMDGIELALRLREQETGLGLILMSGRPENKSRARAEGLDLFLPKPFHPTQVAAMLKRVSAPDAPGQRSAVVVEDDPSAVEFYSSVLSSEGFKVKTASDGVEGLRAVMTTLPDIAIVDLIMPRMDGFELCRRLRRDRATAASKILVVSAKRLEDDEKRTLDSCSDRFLSKPCGCDDLLAAVNGLLDPPHPAAA